MKKQVLGIFLVSLAYATLRYNVFKGVAWSDWSTYVLNKVFALSALGLFVLSLVSGKNKDGSVRSAAWGFTLGHIVLSLLLNGPVYYPKLFTAGHLTFLAGISMLLGVAAVLMIGALRNLDTEKTRLILGMAVFLVGWHAGFQGIKGWIAVSQWPGYMPPITLISAVLGSVGLAASITGRKGSVPRPG